MRLQARRMVGLLVVLATLILPSPYGGATAPSGTCPPVNNTQKYTIAYGSVTIGGAAAPVGVIVEARSPRGDVVGCWVVSAAGSYGMIYIYGEDTSVSPTIPGMKAGETVSFLVAGASAVATPGLAWANDWQTAPAHQINLAASAAPPVAAVVSATRSGSSVVLNWPHASANTSYQVWQGTSPYFTPGSSGSIVGDGATGNCTDNGITVTCSNADAIGNSSVNYFYVVRAFNVAGASTDSNRTGEFDFTLTPGSQ